MLKSQTNVTSSWKLLICLLSQLFFSGQIWHPKVSWAMPWKDEGRILEEQRHSRCSYNWYVGHQGTDGAEGDDQNLEAERSHNAILAGVAGAEANRFSVKIHGWS